MTNEGWPLFLKDPNDKNLTINNGSLQNSEHISILNQEYVDDMYSIVCIYTGIRF